MLRNSLINILIFLAVYFAVHLYQTRNAPSGLAPEIQGIMLDGRVFDKLSMIEKPVLVHFWATWCKVCEFEHGSINNIAQDYSVIGVASQSGSMAEVNAYVENKNLSYPILLDRNGFIAESWGVVGYPTSYIIGEGDQVIFTEVGFTSEFGMRVRLWMASIFYN